MRASIDIGSNSTLCLIGHRENDFIKEFKTLVRVTGLGKGIDQTKLFSDEAMDDTFLALSEFKKELDILDISSEDIVVTATEASRVVTNASAFFEKIKKKLGFEIKLISSEGEAYYTALGVCKGSELSSELESFTVMDIGGASTEFITGRAHPFHVNESISLPVGSVRGRDWIDQSVFEEKMSDALNEEALDCYKTSNLLCVAGTMTSLALMIEGLSAFDSKECSISISFTKFCEFLKRIDQLDVETLLHQYPFLKKRSETVLAGARIAERLGRLLEVDNLIISTLGLRHGVLFEGEVNDRFLG